jgi:alpha-L-arabinofuranosidase
MRGKGLLLTLLVIFLGGAAVSAGAQTAHPASAKVSMTVNAAKVGAPIDPYLYGQFTELLFNLYEKGIWAEMLSDRKFFYPVNSSEKLVPENRKRNFNRWRPIGPDSSVTMDSNNAFVGEHAPEVHLDGAAPRGIRQSGIPLAQGRRYNGHIVIYGDPTAKVEVSLIWGSNPGDRATVALPLLSGNYLKFPFHFVSGATTENATFEISGAGTGTFHIGVVSLMPADNIDGFRADMVKLLRQQHFGIFRWPGGNFASGYDWRDGIGNRDTRPPRYDYAWHTVEYNDVGTDEFLTLCRLLRIDPYLCVNSGFGDAQSAAAWVEYCNGSPDMPLGRLRALNGHRKPYGVKWWGIGNEMYGQWQLGHMYIDQYVIKHNLIGEAMRQADPSIELVASGATPFEMGTVARLFRKPLPAQRPYQFGSEQDWSGQLLEHSSDYINFLSEHLYPLLTSAFDEQKQEFVKTDDPIQVQIRRLPNRVEAAAEAMHEYERMMPRLKDKHIKLAIDEWAGGGRSGFERALVAAEGLQEMFRHTDVIKMAAYTAFISNLSFNGNDSVLSSVGLVFKLYRHDFGTLPVEVTGNSPQPPVEGTIGVDRAKVTSGSPTYPLDVSAALSADHKKLTVAVVNPTEAAHELDFNVEGVALEAGGILRRIAAPNLEADNEPGKPPEVTIQETRLSERPATVTLPPLSISLYEFDVM